MTQLLNLALVPLLAHAGLAIGLGACLNALALLIGLLRRGVYRPAPGWTRFALRLLPALAALAGCWPMPMAASIGSLCRPMPAAGGLAGGVLRQRRDLFRIVVPVRVPSPRLRTAPRVNSRRFAILVKAGLSAGFFVRFVKN